MKLSFRFEIVSWNSNVKRIPTPVAKQPKETDFQIDTVDKEDLYNYGYG